VSPLTRVPLGIMAVLVAGLSLAVEFLGVSLKLGFWALALLVLPAGLAVVYLLGYRTLPYEPPASPARGPPAAVPADDEPFVDPVEEADAWESSQPPEDPAGAPEGGSADAPPARNADDGPSGQSGTM
jgi:hypothetical protein